VSGAGPPPAKLIARAGDDYNKTLCSNSKVDGMVIVNLNVV
jgi:hypothetical protein